METSLSPFPTPPFRNPSAPPRRYWTMLRSGASTGGRTVKLDNLQAREFFFDRQPASFLYHSCSLLSRCFQSQGAGGKEKSQFAASAILTLDVHRITSASRALLNAHKTAKPTRSPAPVLVGGAPGCRLQVAPEMPGLVLKTTPLGSTFKSQRLQPPRKRPVRNKSFHRWLSYAARAEIGSS